MLKCRECDCVSTTGRGWFGYIVDDPERRDGQIVAMYCPPCGQRTLQATPREPHYI